MLSVTDETVETTLTKEKFQISHPGGHVFQDDKPVAHWDDNGIRFRLFKPEVIEAISSALLQDDPLRIRVQGKMHTNNAINMKDMTVESWMLV